MALPGLAIAATASPYPYDTLFVESERTLPGDGSGPVLTAEQVRIPMPWSTQ